MISTAKKLLSTVQMLFLKTPKILTKVPNFMWIEKIKVGGTGEKPDSHRPINQSSNPISTVGLESVLHQCSTWAANTNNFSDIGNQAVCQYYLQKASEHH